MWCIAKSVAKRYIAKNKDNKKSSGGTDLNIQCGRPVLVVQYSTLKLIAFATALLTLFMIIYALDLILWAIHIRIDFGSYLNMVTSGDADVLPTFLAMPAFISVILCSFSLYFIYKLFSKSKRQKLNHILFTFIVVRLVVSLIFFLLCIGVLADVYSEHQKLHDGLMEAMNNYSHDSTIKSQIDILQIEFQCCGSKKYDEWYDIKWFDTSLIRKGNKTIEGQTPFSCCSMKSPYPCIHHGTEMTGLVYLYTPEVNLSISTKGCHSMIKKRKQNIGWGIVGKITLLISVTLLQVSGLRFLQTAHFESYKFEDDEEKTYTIWLIGCYVGTNKKKKSSKTSPPPIPPVPPELKT